MLRRVRAHTLRRGACPVNSVVVSTPYSSLSLMSRLIDISTRPLS